MLFGGGIIGILTFFFLFWCNNTDGAPQSKQQQQKSTRVDWPTIKPWLTKILAGDLAGAKAMTCAELGGKTAPDPNPRPRRRLHVQSSQKTASSSTSATSSSKRRLISGQTKEATKNQFPALSSLGNYIKIDGTWIWDSGCDGTLIGSNVMLAAAHCYQNTELKASRNQMRVWPGAWSLLNPQASTSKFRFASEIIRHPCFTLTNYPGCLELNPENCQDVSKPMEDIAVAILVSDASAGSVVTPLVGQGTYEKTVLEFPVMGTIAGWGRYCDPKADEDPSKCTMQDFDVPETRPCIGNCESAASQEYPTSGLMLGVWLLMFLSQGHN